MDEGRIGILKMFLIQLEEWLGYSEMPGGTQLKAGTANTAITCHASKVFALMETGLPFGIKLSKEVGKLDI